LKFGLSTLLAGWDAWRTVNGDEFGNGLLGKEEYIICDESGIS
jgi:hypothetical protein